MSSASRRCRALGRRSVDWLDKLQRDRFEVSLSYAEGRLRTLAGEAYGGGERHKRV